MSDAHPDADLVKVTRTTTTYEPVTPAKEAPTVAKPSNQAVFLVVGVCAVLLLAGGAFLYESTQNTPAQATQNAADADQQRTQSLNQQASSAQTAADASAAQTRQLTAAAATDRAAAKPADTSAKSSGPATN